MGLFIKRKNNVNAPDVIQKKSIKRGAKRKAAARVNNIYR